MFSLRQCTFLLSLIALVSLLSACDAPSQSTAVEPVPLVTAATLLSAPDVALNAPPITALAAPIPAATSEAATVIVEAITDVAASPSTAAGKPVKDVVASKPQEKPSPAAGVSEHPIITMRRTASHGGERADGLDVTEIRVAQHEAYDRFVFNAVNWEGLEADEVGKPAASMGAYDVEFQGNRLVLTLNGYRAFSAEIPTITSVQWVKNITRLMGEEYADDSGVSLLFTLKDNSCYKAFTLQQPARIVLDIGACD